MPSYYLLDHPNPNGDHFYRSRRGKVKACVVHITAMLQGTAGSDTSCERLARYAATTDRAVSWHSGSDADSSILLLPDDFTAFHVRGYNSSTIGHEINKVDVTWGDEDPIWVTQTLTQAADCLRPRLKALGIPLRKATKSELDRAISSGTAPVGLVSHSDLDPTRRRDPGADFPWARFLAMLEGVPTPTYITSEDNMAVIAKGSDNKKYLTDLVSIKRWIRRAPTVDALKADGIREIMDPEFDNILRDLPDGPEVP